MSFVRLLTAIFLAGLIAISPRLASAATPQAPTPIIFDTDMYSDIDDMLALPMLHALQDRGEMRLVAVTISQDSPWAPAYIDLINSFYGHGAIPIGKIQGVNGIEKFAGKPQPFSPNGINYTQYIAQLKRADGSQLFSRSLKDGESVPEPVSVLRRALAAEADNSVVVVQVGYSSNLAHLLKSPPDAISPLTGEQLIRRKVRLLSLMGGNFRPMPASERKPEWNIVNDVLAAQTLFSAWPSPIVVSGWEIGIEMLFPEVAVHTKFNYAVHHPIADTFRYVAPYYRPGPALHEHPTWDLTSVLYAVRPKDEYFTLSEAGRVTVDEKGATRFDRGIDGRHRYLIQNEAQRAKALEAMIGLISQPPVARDPRSAR